MVGMDCERYYAGDHLVLGTRCWSELRRLTLQARWKTYVGERVLVECCFCLCLVLLRLRMLEDDGGG